MASIWLAYERAGYLTDNTGGPRDTRYLLYADSEIRGFQNLTVLEANCTDVTHPL